MALIRDFVDKSGNHCPQAYFRAVSINISAADQRISLVFYGYRDGQAFADGLQPLNGARKDYTIAGSEFLEIAMAAPVGASLYDVLAHASEDYAIHKKDTPSGTNDPDGNPVLVSFFENSQQV